MGVMIPLIMSSIAAHDRREKEAQRIPREKFLDSLEKSAAMGETAVFNDPKTFKAAEKYRDPESSRDVGDEHRAACGSGGEAP
jgi:hypothetical protein